MDQHGHDVPERYECPVCFSPDPNRYMRCDHPGCTDGRDRPCKTYPTAEGGCLPVLAVVFAGAVVGSVITFMIFLALNGGFR